MITTLTERMPAGWRGVRRSAEEWVRFALHDASGDSQAEQLTEPLIAIAQQDGTPIEELVSWIYFTREISAATWRRTSAAAAELRRALTTTAQQQEPTSQ